MRVSDLIENLQNQEVKLTLPNIGSITEQQLGGFLCNGIHGSGIGFGSFDEFLEKMWVAVPSGEFKLHIRISCKHKVGTQGTNPPCLCWSMRKRAKHLSTPRMCSNF